MIKRIVRIWRLWRCNRIQHNINLWIDWGFRHPDDDDRWSLSVGEVLRLNQKLEKLRAKLAK